MIKHLEALVQGRGRMMTACGIAIGIMALGIQPAAAQNPTIRITPSPATFSLNTNGTITITAENIPSDGLKGWDIYLFFDESQLSFVSATVDPGLVAAWGGTPIQNSTIPGIGRIQWSVSSGLLIGGPSGTVVLGTMVLGAANFGGSGQFTWDGINTRLSTIGPFALNILPDLPATDYVIGSASSDLTITCTQSSPADPNTFVDGDTVTLDCNVTNNGPQATGQTTKAIAMISADTIIDKDDSFIELIDFNSLAAGSNRSIVLTGTPTLTNGGAYHICAKIDVVAADRNNLGTLNTQPNGSILETDETNNTFCKDVQVTQASRDLEATGFSVTPDQDVSDPNFSDPNNIHAGGFFNVEYTLENNGVALARGHRDEVWLSTNSVFDPNSDTLLCSTVEPDLPGLPGGQSVSRSFGADPNQPASQCGLDLGVTPGTYFVLLRVDAGGDVNESDETNNLVSAQIDILPPIPSRIAGHEVASRIDSQVSVKGPGKDAVFVGISKIADLASYSFTLTWSDPNMMRIADPSDITYVADPTATVDPNNLNTINVLEWNGRTSACDPPVIDNGAGTVSISCTSTGTAIGGKTSGTAVLARIEFTAVRIGTGTLTVSDVTAATSDGTPVQTTPTTQTYEVFGDPVLALSVTAPPLEAFPGFAFSTGYQICNTGFGKTSNNVPMTLYLSRDAVIDPSGTPPDQLVCRFIENNPILPNECRTLTASGCKIIVDLAPGMYFAAHQLTTTIQDVVQFALPPRLIAMRKAGSGQSLETTRLPDQIGGSVGSPLANDRKFAGKSASILRSNLQGLDFLAVYEKPGDKPPQIALYRTPKKVDEDLERLNTLRVLKSVRALAGSADINGDGNDEAVLIVSGSGGDYLDFRSVDYVKRKPVIGLSAAITPPFPTPDHVVAAAGVQFDGDPEDEIAVVIEDSSGAQSLHIYDIAVQTPPPPPAPPVQSALTEVASDTTTFGSASSIEGMCSADFDLDSTTQIIVLTRESSGAQAVKVYDPPTGVGTNDSGLVADDLAFGMTTGKKRVVAFTCTR